MGGPEDIVVACTVSLALVSRQANSRLAAAKGLGGTFRMSAYRRAAEFARLAAADPRWAIMFAFSRFYFIRWLVRNARGRRRTSTAQPESCLVESLDSGRILADIEATGVHAGLTLEPSTVEGIRRFAETSVCFGDNDPTLGFRVQDLARVEEQVGRRLSSGVFLNLPSGCGEIERVAADPRLAWIAGNYFGAEAALTDTRLWWNFRVSEREFDAVVTSSFFHSDKDDYRALNFFFYLTPVDERAGPHVYIRGSHRKKPLSMLVSLGGRRDSSLVNYYGSDAIVSLAGQSGFGFAQDPHTFHKATRPLSRNRLTLSLRYAVTDYSVMKTTAPQAAIREISLDGI
jgi:hypothetical protein